VALWGTREPAISQGPVIERVEDLINEVSLRDEVQALRENVDKTKGAISINGSASPYLRDTLGISHGTLTIRSKVEPRIATNLTTIRQQDGGDIGLIQWPGCRRG
jgi:hypothetical protein